MVAVTSQQVNMLLQLVVLFPILLTFQWIFYNFYNVFMAEHPYVYATQA